MNPVTIVGMAVGALLILTAIGVFWSKKEFPAGGIGVTFVGLALVGMSQWSTLRLKAPGLEFEAIRAKLDSTISAAEVVAGEAQNAAAAAEATRQQVSTLTSQLATHNLIPPTASIAIRRALDAAPRTDTTRLRMATDRLKRLNIQVRPRH